MTYRAIQLQRFAQSFRAATEIVTLPIADPAHDEIRVRNHWCGVNGIFDTQMSRNAVEYIDFALPTLTGVEAVGIVEAVGADVAGFAVGDAAASLRFRGGYREMNIGPASDFARLPDVSRDSLGLASTGVAALLALDHGDAKSGDTVAVSAAAGGLGHLIVQLAKARGCRIVAICGGWEKGAFVRGLGADRVIDYRIESVAGVLNTEFKDAIDVAIDTVSGGIFDAFLANLAPHGRLVVSGAAGDMDGKPEIVTGPRIGNALYYKAASVRAFQNGRMTHLWPEARDRLFALRTAGKIHVTFDAVPHWGLEAVPDAVERLIAGKTMGKVVVDLRPRP
jgi:NADPH-dependent curcumin reductase CurA